MYAKYPGQIARDAHDIQVAAQLSARESVLKNAQNMAATAKPTMAKRRMKRQSLLIESQLLSEQFSSLRPLCTLSLCVNFSSPFPYFLTSSPRTFSFSRHRRLRRFLVCRLRHPLIVRRRLFEQFLPRFHLSKVSSAWPSSPHPLPTPPPPFTLPLPLPN